MGMIRLGVLLFAALVFNCNAVLGPRETFPNTSTYWLTLSGVEGGIPSVSTVFTNFYSTNNINEINDGISKCPSNQVVYFHPGVYSLSNVMTVSKSGVVLRGSGSNTVFKFYYAGGGGGGLINVSGANPYYAIANNTFSGSANWTSGYEQGGSNLVVDAVGDLAIGDIVCLDQLNDGTNVSSIGYGGQCTYCGRSSGTRSQQQFSRVTGIAGTTVTIWPPVIHPNWKADCTPQMWWIRTYTHKVGIEDLTIDGNDGNVWGVYGANIMFFGTWNCWVSNIFSVFPLGSHINPYGAGRTEIRHSGFTGTRNSASMSYGILPLYSSFNLYEDNWFFRLVAPLIFNAGTSGNVFAYNYTTNNEYYTPTIQMPSVWAHDSDCSMNLIEGNHLNGVTCDYFFGSSYRNTLFRNRITGFEFGRNQPLNVISLDKTNYNWAVIGNILGTEGIHTNYQSAPVINDLAYYHCIYRLGWNNDNYVNTNIYWLMGTPGVGLDGMTNQYWWNSSEGKFTNLNGFSIYYDTSWKVTNGAAVVYFTKAGSGTPPIGLGNWTAALPAYGTIIGSCGYCDRKTADSIYRHGNWDVINEAIVWEGTNADHTLPDSLLYASAPSYFGTLGFPPYSPSAVTAADMDPTNTPAGFRFIYGFDPPLIAGPEISVSGNSVNIVNGDATPSAADSTSFGSTTVGVTVSKTYTVANVGTAALTTSGLSVPSGFTVTEGLSASINPGGSDTFTVRFNAASAATFTGNVSFTNNDSDESPFTFAIQAVAGAYVSNPGTSQSSTLKIGTIKVN